MGHDPFKGLFSNIPLAQPGMPVLMASQGIFAVVYVQGLQAGKPDHTVKFRKHPI